LGSSITNLLTGTTSGNGTGASTGLGQGIDVNAVVQLALRYDQAKINNLQGQVTGFNTKSSTLAAITSNLTALQSAASALNDPLGVLNSPLATSSNSTAVTATAASTAAAGTHTIAITSLATTSSFYSAAVTASTTALATGDTISISVNGTSVASVTVNSTNNTLTSIAAAINTQTTVVQASVITDANGARLSFVSATSGAPGNLAVTGTLHRTDTTAISFTQAVAGLTAALTVDSVPISSAIKSVSNVITGVTLNLTGATGGTPATLTVSPNTSAINAAINLFVSTYNTAITAINAQFQVGANGAVGILEADGSLRDAQQQLLNATSYSVAGTGGQVNLINLGINSARNGTLTVGQTGLATALSSNFSGVQSFLRTGSTGFAGNLNTVLGNLTNATTGVLGLDALGLTSSSTAISQQVSDLQAALAVKQQNLIAVYARVNTTLQILPVPQSQLSQQLASIPH
jgi:flagellar hook-associated protein 2